MKPTMMSVSMLVTVFENKGDLSPADPAYNVFRRPSVSGMDKLYKKLRAKLVQIPSQCSGPTRIQFFKYSVEARDAEHVER